MFIRVSLLLRNHRLHRVHSEQIRSVVNTCFTAPHNIFIMIHTKNTSLLLFWHLLAVLSITIGNENIIIINDRMIISFNDALAFRWFDRSVTSIYVSNFRFLALITWKRFLKWQMPFPTTISDPHGCCWILMQCGLSC